MTADRLSPSHMGSSFRIFKHIAYHEGGFRALYRGLIPNIMGNSISWGLYFFWYDHIKRLLCLSNPSSTFMFGDGDARGRLSSSKYFFASGMAGLLTSILTNPIWVIKTRMLSTGAHVPGAYASFAVGVRSVYMNEGILGFYYGLVPALFGVSHGALQFMAYEQMKHYCSYARGAQQGEHDQPGEKLGNADLLFVSTLSKIFAGSVTYPCQVLRVRLQTYDANKVYRGVLDVMGQIYMKEGFRGFYKGITPNLVRVLPSTWMTFLVYENVRRISC